MLFLFFAQEPFYGMNSPLGNNCLDTHFQATPEYKNEQEFRFSNKTDSSILDLCLIVTKDRALNFFNHEHFNQRFAVRMNRLGIVFVGLMLADYFFAFEDRVGFYVKSLGVIGALVLIIKLYPIFKIAHEIKIGECALSIYKKYAPKERLGARIGNALGGGRMPSSLKICGFSILYPEFKEFSSCYHISIVACKNGASYIEKAYFPLTIFVGDEDKAPSFKGLQQSCVNYIKTSCQYEIEGKNFKHPDFGQAYIAAILAQLMHRYPDRWLLDYVDALCEHAKKHGGKVPQPSELKDQFYQEVAEEFLPRITPVYDEMLESNECFVRLTRKRTLDNAGVLIIDENPSIILDCLMRLLELNPAKTYCEVRRAFLEYVQKDLKGESLPYSLTEDLIQAIQKKL
ncbi:MAG: hypothetical protein H6850_04355 [Alphaproteobacteria bacterium]|nr:MAG: hypothetical protein H6850_04355 [Alphaproteobacteria bacterium]